MTQVILTIKNKRDLPFLKKLSKAESGVDLEDFDLEGLHKKVASL